MKSWFFDEKNNCYSICSGNYSRAIVSHDDLCTPKSPWLQPSSSAYSTVVLNDIGHGKFLIQYPGTDHLFNKLDLPAGYYKYQPENFPNPERLLKLDLRTDTFYNVNNNLNKVREDIDTFLNSKSIYRELGMSFRRGYLFYGTPGNGKTAQIRDLCRTHFNNAIVIWLSKLPSDGFIKHLNDSPLLKVFIIEEITSHNKSAYEVKTLLDFFDGEFSAQNSIIIGTTNYPHELQKNLMDRPSRFDLVTEIANPTKAEANEYFYKFIGRYLSDDEFDFKDLSVAYIKEICLSHKMFNKPIKQCIKDIKTHKKKVKEDFPDKEKGAIGLVPEIDLSSKLKEMGIG